MQENDVSGFAMLDGDAQAHALGRRHSPKFRQVSDPLARTPTETSVCGHGKDDRQFRISCFGKGEALPECRTSRPREIDRTQNPR